MRRTEPFRLQHAELGHLSGKIAALLDAHTLHQRGAQMREMLLTLARSLADHAAQEDDQLYTLLFRHRDPHIRAKARELREEFGVIYSTVEIYLGVWSRPGAIEEDVTHFAQETKSVLATLGKRIQRENDELYTMIDALPAVSPRADAPDANAWRAAASAFAAEATRFSRFVQDAAKLGVEERTETLAKDLALLYAAALALPLLDEPDDGTPRVVTAEDTTQIGAWAGLAEQYYWQVFDPFVEEPPVVGDLDDDVCFIVGEVRLGLDEWNKGRQQHAAFHWRKSFDDHWGERVVDALRAMQRLVEKLRR